VELRDSKHPDVVLVITRAEWRAFLDAVKRGELDRQP